MHKGRRFWEHVVQFGGTTPDYACPNNAQGEFGMNTSTDPTAARPVANLPALRGVQTKEALARFAGDQERYRHWMLEFVTHGPAAAKQIREAITNGSLETATLLAHSFKGRSGMLGMVELHSIAQSLEMTLRNNEPTALWLDELERTVAEMSEQISDVLGDRCTH
jgi:HPt (histidine-containing phosphotransfer) domain-containing protein